MQSICVGTRLALRCWALPLERRGKDGNLVRSLEVFIHRGRDSMAKVGGLGVHKVGAIH